MPTAAQRQRAAALAQLNSQHSTRMHALAAPAAKQSTSSNGGAIRAADPQPSASRLNIIEADWEDGTFSDDDSDEDAAAFEMDGHDAWTQNYCSICDTLIEPGHGLIAKKDECTWTSQRSPTSSLSARNKAPDGLKSKSGTIKARPPSLESGKGSAIAMTRTGSASRLHATGGTGPLGAAKRTGSAGSRLNALSELRPTTKLHSNTAAKGKQTSDASGQSAKSPALSRKSSTASIRSGCERNSNSRPSSPQSPNINLPRSKKSGVLGNLTPAALKQQEEIENAKIKAPPALYCSERCRQIDEERSSGMGELVYYLQQPTSPTAAIAGQSGPSSYGAWPSRASSASMAALMRYNPATAVAPYGLSTPESECMCPDCLDKNSASGTVPSGASDTTESSASYQLNSYRGQKQRTTSGRIVTPQNLHPPGVHYGNDYFGNAYASASRTHQARSSVSNTESVAPRGHRTDRDSTSQAGTESSAKSSDSGSDLWEPRVRRLRHDSSTVVQVRSEAGSVSNASDPGRGSTTTGTVTPDGDQTAVVDYSISTVSRRPNQGLQLRSSDGPRNDLSTSQASTASPLRLLRQGDHHRALASVDVTANDVVATSPQPYPSSLLSRSMASERTEGGASSGFTTVAAQHSSSLLATSLLDRRQVGRTSTVDGDETAAGSLPPERAFVSETHRFSGSPAPFDQSANVSRAIGTLRKHAQTRPSSRPDYHPQRSCTDVYGLAGKQENPIHQKADGDGHVASSEEELSGGSSVSGSWLRSSISAAWNSLRGLPQAEPRVLTDGDYSATAVPSILSSGGTYADDPTPTPSIVKRPATKRGDVPAYAKEIGRSDIPGECGDDSSELDARTATITSAEDRSEARSVTSAQDSIDSDRQRRKAERERAHRRSSGITVLPPLLGVARPASSANLHSGVNGGLSTARSTRTYSTISARSDGMNAPPDSPLLVPVRSNTPNLRRGSHSASLVGLQEYGTSPGRLGSVGSLGTSPRRSGLGWGALTPLGPAAAEHRATFAQTRMGAAIHPHAHVHSGQQHHHQHLHQHHQHHHHHHGPHHHPAHRSHSSTIALGTLGMGAHPHGNAPTVGRHSTTPSRMSTPRVPENGGEMSGAQLKGEWDGEEGGEEAIRTMQSRSLNRRSLLVAPPRPHSVMSMRAVHGGSMNGGSATMAAPALGMDVVPMQGGPLLRAPTPLPRVGHHVRNASADNVHGSNSGVKLYPVLDVPNRPQIHDRYDASWGLEDGGTLSRQPSAQPYQQASKSIVPLFIEGGPTDEAISTQHAQRNGPPDASPSSRKKLFYFDTS